MNGSSKTTSVYEIHYLEGFERLLAVNLDDYDLLWFDGQTRASSWKPVKVERMKVSDEGCPLRPSDFPSCSGNEMLMLGRAAKEKIGSKLEQYGELLPLACDEGEFWTFNVTCLVDALDEDRSKLLRSSSDGTILMVKKPVFNAARLGPDEVFKVPQFPRGTIFVTSPFVELVRKSGLNGIDFVQVWATN